MSLFTKCFLCFVFLILLVSFASARLGVSTKYSNGFPLVMNPAGNAETYFRIHNAGQDSLRIEVVPEESDVLEFLTNDFIYDVSPGNPVDVLVKVEIPRETVSGQEYRPGALFRTLSGGVQEGGNIQLNTNIRKSFPIIVSGEVIGEFVDTSAPIDEDSIDRGVGFFYGIVFVFLIAIVAMGIAIVVLVRRQRQQLRSIQYVSVT